MMVISVNANLTYDEDEIVLKCFIAEYSRISVARTLIACIPRLF